MNKHILTLENEISELEYWISYSDTTNTTVSSASIGWHVAHDLFAIQQICFALQQSDPSKFKNKIDLRKSYILWKGIIPRGKAKVPKSVIPPAYTKESLQVQVEKLREDIDLLNSIDSKKYFDHPMFGHIRSNKAIKFLTIHTEHHLKIIRDIANAEKIENSSTNALK